jgi:hypothetical protein
MPNTIQGKQILQLRFLAPALDHWIKINTQVAQAWQSDGDVPWWYNERALLSMIAGAIWQTKGIAFEEYSTEKRMRSQRNNVNLYSGRQDLFIQIGKEVLIGECKVCWSGATLRKVNPSTRINRTLDIACADIKKTKPNGQRRIGIVFARPYIRGIHRSIVSTLVKKWIATVRDGVNYSCCAWVFPSQSRFIQGDDEDVIPGVAVFIREV